MSKYIFGALALLLIGGGVWFFLHTKKGAPGVSSPTTTTQSITWAEVSTPSATVYANNATTTLLTGDEVPVGSVIHTDAKGVVVLHFPDGSFAMLDPESSVTLTAVGYDKKEGSLIVHIALHSGTLWSKVLDLVGLNSSWQVETTNAVATVRGTSFMTQVLLGKTKVVGIEHSVTVSPLQKDTRQPLLMSATVTPDTEVTVDDTSLPALSAGKESMATTTVSADISKSDTYKAFKEREKIFDTMRDSLHAEYGEGSEFQKEFRESQVLPFKETILEKSAPSVSAPKASKSEIPTSSNTNQNKNGERPNPLPPTTTTDATISKNTPVTPPSGGATRSRTTTSETSPVSLSVTTDTDLNSGVIDGDKIVFQAILLFSDGTKKDVTSSVKWNVINKIGSFPAPGTLLTNLPVDYAESGEVPGAVYATFTTTAGKELNAASKAFTVHAYVPPLTTTDG
jgi:hypothetical protein